MATYSRVHAWSRPHDTPIKWSAFCYLLVSSAVSIASRLPLAVKLLLQTITKEPMFCSVHRAAEISDHFYANDIVTAYKLTRLALVVNSCFNPQLWSMERRRRGFVKCVHSFVHSFCPSSCRDHRSLLKLGKGMNRLSTTMACNVTRGFCYNAFVLELWLAHLAYQPSWTSLTTKAPIVDFLGTCRLHLNSRAALSVRRDLKKDYS